MQKYPINLSTQLINQLTKWNSLLIKQSKYLIHPLVYIVYKFSRGLISTNGSKLVTIGSYGHTSRLLLPRSENSAKHNHKHKVILTCFVSQLLWAHDKRISYWPRKCFQSFLTLILKLTVYCASNPNYLHNNSFTPHLEKCSPCS